MSDLIRFGISMDKQLLEQLDHLMEQKGFSNRSEVIRDLVRNALVEDQWSRGQEEAVGTITIVYDHHVRELANRLTDHQHVHHHEIVSTLHVHLDHDNCLEVVVVKGKVMDIKQLADELIGTKGVKHGKLVTTTTGRGLS